MPDEIRITVGVHAADASAQHGSDGVTVAEVAGYHEFGTRTIPQRSFIRGWFDEALASGELSKLFQQQLRAVATGRRTLAVAGERIALACEASVKNRIVKHIPPPLAASTIARKGSSTPLIDTGQLRASIRARSEVV